MPPQDLAALLEAAPAPSALLDARLDRLAGRAASGRAYTSDLDLAAALVDELLPAATWSLRGQAGAHALAAVTSYTKGVRVSAASGATPALALLAAATRARAAAQRGEGYSQEL